MTQPAMRVYTCTDHDGRYPVGVASVVVAHDLDEACRLMDAELTKHGLRTDGYSLISLPLDKPGAIILNDGDY